jgi:CRISPR-associated protein Csd1
MILAALNDYYQRLSDDPDSDISAPGYSQQQIGYAIVLFEDGRVADVLNLHDERGKKPVARAMSVPQPEKRTAGVKANFLWDKTSYVLGVSASSKRSVQEHDAFKARHREALAGTDDPGLKALLAFLEAWTPEHFHDEPAFVSFGEAMLDANLVFILDGERGYLHDRPAAQAVWVRLQGGAAGSQETCLVTGERAPIARLHPAIKGVNGAQSSGASIVSFNLEAFKSYGKDQGANAPVSEAAAFAYTTALNHLLRRDPQNRQRLQIGDTTVVFWAQAPEKSQAEAAEDVFAAFFDPREDDLRATGQLQAVMEQVRRARPLRELGAGLEDGTRIFVLGLAPNASRLSIRFWETDTLARFATRLAQHYDDLTLQPSPWRYPPSPRFLARAVAPLYDGKAKDEDVPPSLAGELTRAILAGTRYPGSLLGALVMRFRSDGVINGTRVALCKAVLARNARLNQWNTHKEVFVSLDTRNADPGYLLGRLFSCLENIQRAALGKQINATIRDRYYGAASATPAGVFPMLVRNAQHHLSRLRKDKPGLAVNLERDIGEIIDLLGPAFPRAMAIEAQGHFAIGYYHQTQARYARADAQDATEEDQGDTE